MNSSKRRENIYKCLIQSNSPLKGVDIAQRYSVTRQVIVKDIAILRAAGKKIISTPDGYIVSNVENKIRAIIAVNHNEDQMFKEMSIIIKYGGIIEDIIVEHPLYGEIKGMLMIKNYNDLKKFSERYVKQKAKLLSVLTNGIHIHTISAENQENLNCIISELKRNNFIVSD